MGLIARLLAAVPEATMQDGEGDGFCSILFAVIKLKLQVSQ
jgi:hypothetical protein